MLLAFNEGVDLRRYDAAGVEVRFSVCTGMCPASMEFLIFKGWLVSGLVHSGQSTFIMRLFVFSTFLALATNTYANSGSACTYPQPCWPSESDWNSLNSTLQGSLVRARPPAYVCHQPNYDEAQCQVAQQNWTKSVLHLIYMVLVLTSLLVSFGVLDNLEPMAILVRRIQLCIPQPS
jgi:hypothetical protein